MAEEINPNPPSAETEDSASLSERELTQRFLQGLTAESDIATEAVVNPYQMAISGPYEGHNTVSERLIRLYQDEARYPGSWIEMRADGEHVWPPGQMPTVTTTTGVSATITVAGTSSGTHPIILQEELDVDQLALESISILNPAEDDGPHYSEVFSDIEITERRVPKHEVYSVPWIEYPDGSAAASSRWRILVHGMKPVLDGLFPDNWDFRKDDEESKGGMLTVKYPYLTVSRHSEQISHDISELYVRFYITPEHVLLGDIKGTRGELKSFELNGQYAHSHLQNSAINGFGSFCQGSTVMRDIMSRVAMEGFFKDGSFTLNKDVIMEFEGLLHQCSAFMQHEATGGHPHRYISKIREGIKEPVYSTDIYQSIQNFCRLDLSELPMKIQDGVVSVEYENKTEDLLVQAATKTEYEDSWGERFSIIARASDALRQTRENPSFKSFMFRGQIVKQKIIFAEDEQIKENTRRYCHATISTNILNKLNDKLKSIYFTQRVERRYASERDNLLRYASRVNSETDNPRNSELENLVALVPNSLNGVERGNVRQAD